jgi:hypothetical protein
MLGAATGMRNEGVVLGYSLLSLAVRREGGARLLRFSIAPLGFNGSGGRRCLFCCIRPSVETKQFAQLSYGQASSG